MSLLQRRPRPLSRDAGSFRDDRLFIIACDDTFFRIPRVQVHVVSTTDGTSAAIHVLERLKAVQHEPDDELWMVLDVDHCDRGRHLQGLTTALAEARRFGIRVALNKPCFELWLLLHHVEETEVESLKDAADVENALRGVLGQYNKTKLNHSHFPLTGVGAACARAARLDTDIEGLAVPPTNTARVYRIWKAIADKALPTQIPDPLQGLTS